MTDPLADLSEDLRACLRSATHPRWLTPMQARLTDQPFSRRDWLFERKLDGMRCLAFRRGRELRLLSRNRKHLNDTYPELEEARSDRWLKFK